MGIFNKFKEMLGSDDDFYDDDDEFEIMTTKKEERPAPTQMASAEEKFAAPSKKDGRVMNIHTTAQLQVILVRPERFDDAVGIADNLLEKRTVVLNLESTNKEISRRLIDFLSGVAYANGGQIKKVANSTFIITPYNVDIMGDLIAELENTDVFF